MADVLENKIENEEIVIDNLEDVNGGYDIRDPAAFQEKRFRFSEEEVQR
ncbi:MAG: hypothetical protein K6C68_01810 [Ruminococcus sp.]|nr:hypothetical protein [Ruminococcus sp.]